MYETAVRHTNSTTGGGISATGLGKRYGDLWALRGLDLEVAPGQVLGLLGHNGAGKTTAIRILTTLAEPTEGSATVAGFDVVRRGRLGAGPHRRGRAAGHRRRPAQRHHEPRDGRPTAPHVQGRRTRSRRELLEQLELTDATDRLVKTFSGGMRRRLDLAASLVAHPQVLFLDEPTTGLDPRSRNDLWHMLRQLADGGTTIVLTTQYLEEADRLADDIVVLDHGRVVASGTPEELKSRIGNDRLDVKVAAASDLVPAAAALSAFAANDPTFDEDELTVTVAVVDGTRLIDVVRSLDEAGIDAADLNRRQASLDDVFLTLTTPHQKAAPQEAQP